MDLEEENTIHQQSQRPPTIHNFHENEKKSFLLEKNLKFKI